MPAVHLELQPSGAGRVIVDGHDIGDAVSAIGFRAQAGQFVATIDLVVLDTVTADGQATIDLPERTHQALVALGWTPPAGGT